MDGSLTADELRELLRDAPAGPWPPAVEAHVENCAACQRTLEGMRADATWLGRRGPPARDCPEFLLGLMESSPLAPRPAADPTAPPRPPELVGLEIPELLGSGGMVVVYRAWQANLRWTIALKMIRAAAPDAAYLDRFGVEVQALARVQRANIVAVDESGTCRDGPFLALEYVRDGNLADRLSGQPQPAPVASGLTETPARAIQEAHCRGILRRDLKPAHILR